MPKPSEAPAYTLLVAVSGQPLAGDIAELMASGYVDTSLNVPDLFALRFTDNDAGLLGKANFTIGVAVKLTVQPADNTAPITLLDGEVTALETEVDSSGKHLIVRGFDKTHRLFRGKKVAAYVNVLPADIARKIAQAAGLRAGKMTTKGVVAPHVAQNGLSDWEFLNRLARQVGAEVAFADGALDFRDPAPSSAGPAAQQDSKQNAFVIEHGRNLTALRATVTAADQVPGVEVRSWDPKQKRAVVGTAQPKTASADLGALTPASIAGKVGSPKWIEADSRLTTQSQCDLRAAAVAERLAGSFAELDGIVIGNPDLRAGKAVSLAGVGNPFDGKYLLTSARHEFSPEEGYRTAFTVSNASDRSLYGVTNGAGAGTGTSGAPGADHLDGVMVAIVTDIKDPEGMGRVKLALPMLAGDYESGWCRVVQLGAGAKRGVAWLPEVNDEVLVAFGMGHADDPYVLGGIYNGKDAPDQDWKKNIDSSGKLNRRALVSRTGMLLELVETPSEERLTISTNAGAQKITLTQKSNQAIEIVSEGPVSITAKQAVTVNAEKDITVKTGTGTVSLKGNKVAIEAMTDLSLKGTNVKVDASASAELAGASAKVTGTGTAELSASGVTTVKGSLIKIN